MYWQTLIIAMKKLFFALSFGLLATLGTTAQTNQDSIAINEFLSLQIGQNINPVYDSYGKMIQGQAQVFFTLSDSSTVELDTVVADNETLKRKLTNQMKGMRLKARPEDLHVAMNVRIHFVQK